MFGPSYGKFQITARMADMSGAFDGASLAKGSQDVVTTGVVAGTRVATRQGWREVEAISVGDEVLTFDNGLQPVTAVRRNRLTRCLRKHLPLCVPANALGNRTPLWLMPDQAVVIENDAAEALLGDPFAAIPAAALDGLLGIARAVPGAAMEVVTLCFEDEQLVFTATAAMLHCPADAEAVVDLFRIMDRRSYNRVPDEVAAHIARAIAMDYANTAANLPPQKA